MLQNISASCWFLLRVQDFLLDFPPGIGFVSGDTLWLKDEPRDTDPTPAPSSVMHCFVFCSLESVSSILKYFLLQAHNKSKVDRFNCYNWDFYSVLSSALLKWALQIKAIILLIILTIFWSDSENKSDMTVWSGFYKKSDKKSHQFSRWATQPIPSCDAA